MLSLTKVHKRELSFLLDTNEITEIINTFKMFLSLCENAFSNLYLLTKRPNGYIQNHATYPSEFAFFSRGPWCKIKADHPLM